MNSRKRMDIDFARPVFGDQERGAVMDVLRGHWLASGEQNQRFEEEFAEYIGVPYAVCCNSGSSANLLALASLDLPKGSKVITSGCGFPATLSPILHLGYKPVLVDYDIRTHNASVDQIVERMPGAKALILAHTMGSPVDMRPIMEAAAKYGVAVIEDCCEALGASLDDRKVGAWGDIGTFSFYPSHQITAAGGGGMVTFKDKAQFERARSLRDWGKLATWDKGGRNNTVYQTEVDGMPYFAHYTYATVGWNFKLPEVNAAFGREQMRRLPKIVSHRRQNHDFIESRLPAGVFEPVSVPEGAVPSWFGVILTLKEGDRNDLGERLEALGIRHRPFFAGNITRHKPFKHLKTALPVADRLMRDSLFVGCWAGLSGEQLDYMAWGITSAVCSMQDAGRGVASREHSASVECPV